MLTDEELERYARHIVLQDVGGAGQARLKASRVAVVGAGGLGSPCLLYLAAAGVGALGIIEHDEVALSNLQRQVLFSTQEVGDPKAEAAARRLSALNPHVTIVQHPVRLDTGNARELLQSYDLVVDGSDSFATRLAVADACLDLRIPLVSGAVGMFEGQVAVFRGHEPDMPCYRCFVGANPEDAERSCADQGVLGPLTGVVGSMQALEALKELGRFGRSLAGRLLIYDGLEGRMRTIRLPKDPGCPACGTSAPQ